MVDLYNHLNSPVWSQKNGVIKGMHNGARSYSEVITKHYFPIFKEVLEPDGIPTAVITVTTENNPIRFGEYERIFLFLHECRYLQQPTIARAQKFAAMNSHATVYFIVWSEDTAIEMRKYKLNAIFLPMAIDVQEVRSHLLTPPPHKSEHKIIWFGNVREQKRPYYKYFISEANKQGLTVDTISNSTFNKQYKMTRDEIMQCLQYYRYGVGVGICAHEMSALGLKVFIYSYNFKCNCAYNEQQGKYYIHRNLCSPEESKILVPDALKHRKAMTVIEPVDVHKNAKLLENCLRNIIKI